MNQFFRAGIEAMANDEPRFAPANLLTDAVTVEAGLDACEEWFNGWDFANMAAKVPGWSEAENEAMFAATGNDRL